MKKLLICSMLCASLLASAGQGKNPNRIYQLSELKKTTISIQGKKLSVWLMDTPTKRNEGMMFLKSPDVKIDQGMLFVFAYSQPLSFWMKNTLIPLDIAYIDSKGKILNTEQMKPLDESGNTPSKGEALYALEMKKGAFKKFGIHAGQKVVIPKSVKANS